MDQQQHSGLCLTRKINESVIITTAQGDIVVTLIGVMGGKARMLFESENHEIKIFRAESEYRHRMPVMRKP